MYTGYLLTNLESAAGVAPVDYTYPPGDLRRYGGVGDGSTDNSAALTAAFKTGHLVLGGGPQNKYLYGSNVVVPQSQSAEFDGQGCVLMPSGSAAIQNTNATVQATTAVSGGVLQGAVSCTLTSASSISVGQLLWFSNPAFPSFWAHVRTVNNVTGAVTFDTPFPFTPAGTTTVTAYALTGAGSFSPSLLFRNCTFDGTATTTANAAQGQCVRAVNCVNVELRNVVATNFVNSGTAIFVLFEIYLSIQVNISNCRIYGNNLATIPQSAAMEIDDSNQVLVEGNLIDGNHFGCNITRCCQATASNNVFHGNRTYGLSVNEPGPSSARGVKYTLCGTAIFSGNSLDDYASPVRVDQGFRVICSGNSIRNAGWQPGTNTTDAAIELAATNFGNMYGIILHGNVIENSGGLGILIDNGSSAALARATISANYIRRTNAQAIYVRNQDVTVVGNFIEDWDLAGGGVAAIDYLQGATINENTFFHSVSATKPCVAVSLVSTYKYAFRDNKSPTGNPIFTGGSLVENAGSGTIASGSTSVIVAHGLLRAPSADELTITATAQTTSNVSWWWVSGISATQFTLTVWANPGAGGFQFAWRGSLKMPFTA